MMSLRLPLILLLLTSSLLSGCSLWSDLEFGKKDTRLQDALQDYTTAKTANDHANDGDTQAQDKLVQARTTYEDTALETADEQRKEGAWYQARQILDTALIQVPNSTRLKNTRQDIETERMKRIRLSDCRIGAARARFLVEKSSLLQARAPLETKDVLQDWQIRRERTELDQLAVQLRDCAIQALAEQRLPLAEETIDAAALIHKEDFVREERRLLEQLKNPPVMTVERPPVAAKPVVKKPVQDTPLQKAGRARMALQSAMTRGDLRQAKASLEELRKLEGNTPQLQELDESINAAIAAYIAETHEQANELYRGRQIVQARDLWQKILEISPEDTQARANLERADRVLKKLDELQSNTQEVQPDAPTPTPPQTITPVIKPAP